MPQTSTANLADFEPNISSATASLDEFQPEALPEVKQAIAAVPRPNFQPPAPPDDTTQKIVDALAPRPVEHAAPTGEMPGSFEGHPENVGEYAPRTIGRVAQAVPKLANYRNQPSSETAKAATDIVSGAGEATLPFAPIDVAAAPLSAAVGFGAGALASEGAGRVAHGKVSPETEDLIRSLAFWAPTVAGRLAGVRSISTEGPGVKGKAVSAFGGRVGAVGGVTPDEFAAGVKVGPFEGTVRIPRTPPAGNAPIPPTLEGEVAPPPTDIPQAALPPQPTEPHPGAPVDHMAEGASHAVAMANEEAQAMRMVSGLPATPPPPPVPPAPAPPGPPVPPEISQGHISQDTAMQIGSMLAKLPPDLRAQATQEVHQTLSQSILQMGKVVTPSGQLEIITKPERADKVAQRIINDEVARQEKILAESQKAAETVPVPVAAPVSKFQQGLRARRARNVNQEQIPPAVPGEEQAAAPQNSGTASLEDFTPQSSGPAAPPPVPSKTGSAALSDLAPTNFLKGDQVVLPGGANATVSWVSPRLSIVRVKTDQGKVISIGAKQLKSAQPEPVTPAYPPKAEAEPKFKHGSTQAVIPDDSEAAKALEMARQRISPSDVAGKGTDVGGNHLTVRYGIKGDDHAGIKKYLSSLSPFEASLGKTEKFPPSEHSDGAAVIHAPVEAPELHKINKELEKHGEFTEPSFGEYKPHATVAYVKPDKADRYVGMSATAGKKFAVNSIAITDRNGKQTEVPLEGKAGSKVAFEPETTAQAAPGAAISPEHVPRPTHKKESAPQDVVAKESSTTKEATPAIVEGGRAEILQSEITALRDQYKAISEKVGPVTGTYGPEKRELVDKANEVHLNIREREDELARLRGEPTRAEKQELRKKESEKSFAERPQNALKYSDDKQSQHWQVLEPDYIEKRFEQKQKTYERAIEESKADLGKAKPGTKAHSEALMNLKFREAQLKRYQERDRVQALSFKKEYLDLVKKAVSHGSPVPDEVIDQHPEFTLAKTARERYEKGRHTSFANRSVAINDVMQKEEGFKVKHQDGKAIPDAQVKEISDGVNDILEVLGPELRDMMRGTDLTIAHTNGKHPFLSDAGGQYHPVDRSISAGVKDFLGRPIQALAHELGHWMDYEAGRVLNVKSFLAAKHSWMRGKETAYLSEADGQLDRAALYSLARTSMTDTREVSRMLKLTKTSDLPNAERAEVERVKVVLGHYWRDPRELWARMFEQYIADKLGRESMATETIERYLKAPAWWGKEAWAKLKPMVEQEITKRMDALRERYAPTAEPTEEAASPLALIETAPPSEGAKPITQRPPVAGQPGGDTTLNTANGNLPAKYRVVEAADLLPSHNPQTFGRNANYPEGIQERTYDTSKEAQARVIQQAQNYDPNYTINTNPDAVNGPPIITPDGIVLGGNSRAMSTQRLYKSGKGSNYKSALLAQAQTFGLDKEAIRLMTEPVLVREVAQPENLEATRRLASDLNKSMTGALGVSERAVSAGKSITRESLEKVAAMMDSMGADTSLRDLMRERGNDLVSMLVKDGAITERERPQFVDTATGGLSEEGKTFVERALLGSVVDDPRLMDATPKSVLNKLDSSLAALSSLSPRTDAYNILPLVRSALHDHAEIASQGSNVETFLDQSGLFGGERIPAIDAITRLLAEKPTVVKQKLRQFAQDAGFDVQGQATLGLMEPVGPAKAFNDAFGTNLTEDELSDSIVRAAQISPIIGGSHEAGTPGSPETSAAGVQQRPAGEARPSSTPGTGTPAQGKSEPEASNQLDLLAGESGSFEPGKIGATVAELVKQDVAPALKKAGIGLSDSAALFIKAFYPRIEESNPVGRWTRTAALSDAVDALMKLKGDRARALSEFDAILSGIEKMFDKLPEDNRVDFVDRLQTGKKQPTQELEGIASALRTIMDEQRRQEQVAANLGRTGATIELSRKENYFHNWWNTPPGREPEADDDARIFRLFSPRRPLEGSKGYNKRQSYTLKTGMEAGGKPETTNPVRILRHRIEDGMKFVTARAAWERLHELDLRQYVRLGERPPAGFDKVDDRIARVYFPAESGEGPIKGGEWYVEANTARLLNNMLSRDLIRANPAGRSLMWLKNASTALELGLSPFHAVFETIEAASSQLALGLQRSYNLGFRGGDLVALGKGIMEMATSPVAPITLAREGAALPAYVEARVRLAKIGITQFGSPQIEGQQPHGIADAIPHFREVRKQAAIRRLLKQYPDLDQLVDDMFTGGLIIGQHRDYQVRAFGKTAAEAWTAGNHLGAILRAGMSLPQTMMKPLFQWYIPNLKYSLFLKMMSEQAQEHAAELEDGSLTRPTLARRVADSVENRFGELNFDNLFLDRTVKTALQFAFRSVTYKLGTAREFAGAAGGQGAELAKWAQQAYGGGEDKGPGALPKLDPRASWVFSLLATTVAMGTIAAKLLTHKYPWEWLEEDKKEGGGDLRHLYLETVHPRTGDIDSRKKPVRISLPTYWKDVEHVSSSPSQYVLSSLSSTLSKGLDLAENRDYFGNYVYNPNDPFATKAKQAAKYAFPMPFSVSNYQRGKQMNEPKTAWLSAFGFPRAPSDLDFTPAEKALRDVIKASRAPATPEQMEAWRAKREAYEQGKLSAAEARRFIKQERESFLEREFKNSAVTYSDAVRIHNLATPEEKPLLDRLLRVKRSNQLKRYGAGEVERKETEAAR